MSNNTRADGDNPLIVNNHTHVDVGAIVDREVQRRSEAREGTVVPLTLLSLPSTGYASTAHSGADFGALCAAEMIVMVFNRLVRHTIVTPLEGSVWWYATYAIAMFVVYRALPKLGRTWSSTGYAIGAVLTLGAVYIADGMLIDSGLGDAPGQYGVTYGEALAFTVARFVLALILVL